MMKTRRTKCSSYKCDKKRHVCTQVWKHHGEERGASLTRARKQGEMSNTSRGKRPRMARTRGTYAKGMRNDMDGETFATKLNGGSEALTGHTRKNTNGELSSTRPTEVPAKQKRENTNNVDATGIGRKR
ncbi:hypothetical protein R1flu_023637 [Riccia fluitans]|uniref:Uncharacterized protein n=1 Tax=Riccia fluitans TaxID=41844 RepID=A0ABD1XSK4_9MARC